MERWLSSTSRNTSRERFLCSSFSAVLNLLIMVVTTSALPLPSSSTRCRPLAARAGLRRVWANVAVICRSKSLRSVTITTFGLQSDSSIRIYFASITMVRLLPLPCVCQTTPLCRLPFSSGWAMVLTITLMAKYC